MDGDHPENKNIIEGQHVSSNTTVVRTALLQRASLNSWKKQRWMKLIQNLSNGEITACSEGTEILDKACLM